MYLRAACVRAGLLATSLLLAGTRIDAASLTLVTSPGPVLIGRPVTLTAILNPSSATGTITFYDAGLPIATEPVTAGQAAFTTSLLAWRVNVVSARYNGDRGNGPAGSTAASITVVSAPSSGFPPATALATDGLPQAVAIADLNKDGIADLITANGFGTISILMGAGAGNFAPASNIAAGTNPAALAVADFNGDRIPDIAVAAHDYAALASDGAVFVLLGSPNGTFSAPVEYPAGNGPTAMVAGDWNGDGIVDLAVTNFDDDTVSILLGRGDGTFAPGVVIASGSGPVAIAAADFNADNNADLAVANSVDNTVSVLLGDGAGHFAAQPALPAGQGPAGIVAADFNADGKADLAVADGGEYPYGFNSGVSVLLGIGNGTFQAAIPAVSGPGTTAIAVGDLNGDGTLDIAVAAADGLELLAGEGDGVFQLPVSFAAGSSPVAIAVGQFDGSGTSAVAIASIGDNAVFVLNGAPAPCTFALSPSSFLFDANGGPETLTLSSNSPGCAWSAVANSWLSVPLSGLGGGTLAALDQPNTTGTPLQGSISIGGASVATTQAATVAQFSDVHLGDYDFDAVDLLKYRNVTSGCGAQTFCPDLNITRAQMAILIVRAVMGGDNFTVNQSTPYFADVPSGSFGYLWIQKMFELGITSGCNSTDFCPNDPLNRAQMAIFIIRARFGAGTAFDIPPAPYFTDVNAQTYGYQWVQRMRFDQITSGCGLGTYCPTGSVTRGQMAVFLMRGLFNQLLAAGTPVISQISPAVMQPGSTATFTVTGLNTNFLAGVTALNLPAGITAGPVSVAGATSLTVDLTAASNIRLQPVSIFVVTNSEEAILPNGLSIVPLLN